MHLFTLKPGDCIRHDRRMVGKPNTSRSAPDDAEYESALQMVRGAFGEDVLLRLVAEFGDGRVYIPQNPTERSSLCQVLTLEQARRLAAVFAGEDLSLPLLRGARLATRVEALLKAGKRPCQISRELDCSRRTVHKVKKRLVAAGDL